MKAMFRRSQKKGVKIAVGAPSHSQQLAKKDDFSLSFCKRTARNCKYKVSKLSLVDTPSHPLQDLLPPQKNMQSPTWWSDPYQAPCVNTERFSKKSFLNRCLFKHVKNYLKIGCICYFLVFRPFLTLFYKYFNYKIQFKVL